MKTKNKMVLGNRKWSLNACLKKDMLTARDILMTKDISLVQNLLLVQNIVFMMHVAMGVNALIKKDLLVARDALRTKDVSLVRNFLLVRNALVVLNMLSGVNILLRKDLLITKDALMTRDISRMKKLVLAKNMLKVIDLMQTIHHSRSGKVMVNTGSLLLLLAMSGSLLGQEVETEVGTLDANDPDGQKDVVTELGELLEVEEDIRRLTTVRVAKKIASGRQAIDTATVKDIPGGLNDPLASVRIFPGVTPSSPFSSGLEIRGGATRDTSYRFNDVVIGTPFHDVYLLSVFPPEIISEIVYYPGGYPVTYENVQGSVIDLEAKGFYDYNDTFSITSLVTVVGPTFSYSQTFLDSFRFTIGGRASYLDYYFKLLNFLIGDRPIVPNGYDGHFFFDWEVSPEHHFNFFVLLSTDRYSFNAVGASYSSKDYEALLNEDRIDRSYEFRLFWDSEAIQYQFDRGQFSYRMSLSRYSEQYQETNYKEQSYQATNEEYVFRHGFDYIFNDALALKSYVKYSLDRGVGTSQYHPAGLSEPARVAFSSGTTVAQLVSNYTAELLDEAVDVLRHRMVVGSGLELTLPEFSLDLGAVLYVGTLSEDVVNADVRVRATYLPPLEKGALEFFGYGGRFIQYPDLAVPEKNILLPVRLDNQLYFQDYVLTTPYSYQFGLGTLWDPGPVEISAEGYTKLLYAQLVENPTVDAFRGSATVSSFSNENGNHRTVNDAAGIVNGLEFQIKNTEPVWLKVFLSYSFSKAVEERRQLPYTYDRGKSLLDGGTVNNGLDYLAFTKVRVPSTGVSEHVIKATALVKISGRKQRFETGIRFTANSGFAYTPKVLGYNSLLAGAPNYVYEDEVADNYGFPNGSTVADIVRRCLDANDTCNFGILVDDPSRLNAERYPWSVSFDVKFNWIFFENDRFNGSITLELISFNELFYSNAVSYLYNYEPNLGEDAEASASRRLGRAATGAERESSSLNLFLPVIGLELNF